MRRRLTDRKVLAEEIAKLSDLPLDSLKERWQKAYGAEPPRRLGQRLLLRSLAYKLQEKALGGLDPMIVRILQQAFTDAAAAKIAPVAMSRLKPGTRLLRQWHGETHEVILLDEGVLYRGERLRSLTEAAKVITGVHWSGPKFFGLRRGGRKNAA